MILVQSTIVPNSNLLVKNRVKEQTAKHNTITWEQSCQSHFGTIVPMSLQGRRETGGRKDVSPRTLSWNKFFFPREITKHKIFTFK